MLIILAEQVERPDIKMFLNQAEQVEIPDLTYVAQSGRTSEETRHKIFCLVYKNKWKDKTSDVLLRMEEKVKRPDIIYDA